MRVLLGIAIEVVLVAVALTFSGVKGARPLVADLVQRVSWSALVCVGMAFGKVVAIFSNSIHDDGVPGINLLDAGGADTVTTTT